MKQDAIAHRADTFMTPPVTGREGQSEAAGTGFAPVRDWRIHLGAHKTATTHLQETLSVLRPELAAQGVDFLVNRDLRDQGFARAVLNPGRLQARVPFLRRNAMQRLLERDLADLRTGPARVVISEENLLGSVRRALTGTVYPRAGIAVAMLANLARDADMTFFLSVRSFDKFLPSAYAETLKWGPPPEGGFEAVRRAAEQAPPSWFGLFERLRHAAGGVPIRIWRQEDYRDHKAEIMHAFCGCDIPALPEVPDPAWTSSPSADAITRAEALPASLSSEDWHREVKALYDGSSDEELRFAPFPKAERDALKAAYVRDLERIEALAPGTLMRF